MKSGFPNRLDAARTAVERLLERLLDEAPPRGGAHVPDRLIAAMRYATLGGGKRLRPFVVIESARLFGREDEGVLRTGAALECIHCYSLIHDDLPAMDDDDVRRGRPTVHRAFDEATAILAGDALQSLAFAILADPATDADAGMRGALVAGLAEAAGPAGMAGGQMLDLGAAGRHLDEKAVEEMQAMKTGALFRYAAEAGAILGRAGEAERAALTRYGAVLGAAFQLADDLIDAIGDAAAAGKATAKDAGRGKATLVGLRGIAGARAALADKVAAAAAELRPFGDRGQVLVDTARFLTDDNG